MELENKTPDVEQVFNEFKNEGEFFDEANGGNEDKSESTQEPEFDMGGEDPLSLLNNLPPDYIRMCVSPTSEILKRVYVPKFDKNQKEEISEILTDSDKLIQLKKTILAKAIEQYCRKNRIRPSELVNVNPIYAYLALELGTMALKSAELEKLLKEQRILKGEEK